MAVGSSSWTAVVTASMKPWSVLGAKYTAMVVPGATAPNHLDVEHYLAVRPVCAPRLVLSAVNADCLDARRCGPELGKYAVRSDSCRTLLQAR